jgi:predicted acetyltransferase
LGTVLEAPARRGATRTPALHDLIWEIDARADGEKTPTFYLAHPTAWPPTACNRAGTTACRRARCDLHEMWRSRRSAHASLWDALLGVDLVGEVSSWRLPLDDPLPYLLHDQRQVRTTAVNDAVWVNVRDAATCFAARTYGTTDRLVVEADGVRWAIDGSPDGASVRKVRTRADLVTDQATLGPLLYGGVRPTVLAAGRRLELRSTEVARRADRFFLGDVMPHCQTNY